MMPGNYYLSINNTLLGVSSIDMKSKCMISEHGRRTINNLSNTVQTIEIAFNIL